MKLFKIVVIMVLLVLVTLTSVAIGHAGPPSPQTVMADMASRHTDFGCVKDPTAPMARLSELDAFANEKQLDADAITCYWWTWLFDRDQNALNPGKGHYAVNGKDMTDYDRAALHYADLNQLFYDLGGQPEFKEIRDTTNRPATGWWLYPTRHGGE